MRLSRRRIHRVVTVFLYMTIAAVAGVAAADSPEQAEPAVTVTPPDPHPWWPSRYAMPVWARIENAQPGDLVRLSLANPTLIQHGAVRLPDSGRHLVEMTVIGTRVPKFTWDIGGQSDNAWLPLSRYFTGNDWEGRVWVVALDGTLYREMVALDPDIAVNGGQSYITAESVPHSVMPSRWQNYAGFYGTIVATPRSLQALNPEQRTALARAILWLDARLWVVDGDMADVLHLLGLTADADGASDLGRGVRMQRLGNGAVMTLAGGDPQTFIDSLSKTEPDDLLSKFLDIYAMPDFTRFYDGLEGVGIGFILSALIVLGLILGPVNYWYVRRRKNPLLFFILTPVTAVIGGAAILVGSALMEGGGGRYNEHAILVARSGGDDAFVIDYRLVRPGFWLPDVRFSADTIVLPGGREASASARVIDWTDGIRLGPGWFHSRAVDAYLTARPVVARLAVDVVRENDFWRITNNLDHAVVSARIYTENDGVLQTGPLPAGSEVRVRADAQSSTVSDARQKFRYLNDIGFTGDISRVRLVAECRGLPYIDDGGFGGRRANGRYYYVLLDESLEAGND